MCASVPHSEAARTRIRTSEGPQAGTSTSAHSRAPGRGAVLRIAFILFLGWEGTPRMKRGCDSYGGGLYRQRHGRSNRGRRGAGFVPLEGVQEASALLEPPGDLQTVIPAVLLEHVLQVMVRPGVEVGRVEQVVDAGGDFQTLGDLPAQQGQVHDRETGGVITGEVQA